MSTNNFNFIYVFLFLIGQISICQDYTNYISIRFKNPTRYDSSFLTNKTFNNRGYIKSIRADQTNVNKDEPFSINRDLFLFFKNDIESLENFFNTEYDPLMEGAYSIKLDRLTGMGMGSFKSVKNLFKGCKNLEIVDLPFLHRDSLTDLSYMYYGCILLKQVSITMCLGDSDCSYIDTSVKDMSYMFYGCTSLTNVYIGGIWSPINLNSMFYGCNSLTSITFELFYLDQVTSMNSTFYGCKSLTSLELKYRTESVTNMNSMFRDCSSLKTLEIPKFDTSLVTDMDYMFYGCSSLEKLDLSKFNSGEVKKIDHLFTGCSSLTSFNISGFNILSSITDMSNMFAGLNHLKILDLSFLDLSEVNKATNIFKNTTLKYINLKNVSISKIFSDQITNTFDILFVCQNTQLISKNLYKYCCEYDPNKNKCNDLDLSYMTIYYNKTIQYNKAFNANAKSNNRNNIDYILTPPDQQIKPGDKFTLGEGNFIEVYFSSPLTNLESFFDIEYDELSAYIVSIDLSTLNISNIISVKKMFKGCSSLTSIDFPDFNANSLIDMSYMFKGCSSLLSIDFPDFNTSSLIDMSYMFNGCSSLETIGDGMFGKFGLNIGHVVNMSSIFSGCIKLTRIYLKTTISDELKDTSSMFSGCSSLEYIDLNGLDTGSVTNMNSMFSGCSSLQSINFKGFNTKSVTDMNNIFSGCSSLKTINFPNFNANSAITMSALFSRCSSLETIDLSNFNSASVTDMSSMFSGCSSLKTINFPNFNTISVKNMSSMFSGCSLLKKIDLSNFNTESLTDMSFMFSGCSNLTSLDLNFSTGEVTTMRSLFEGCNSLEFLDISNFNTTSTINVESLFSGCNLLKVVNMSGLDLNHVKNANEMFYGLSNLDFIDLNNIEMSESQAIQSEISNNLITKSNLKVCKKENKNVFTYDNDNLTYICCNYNIQKLQCESSNYIIVHYNRKISYTTGFVNEFRNGISFFNNEQGNVYIGKELIVNSTLEIHILPDVTSLKSFFDSDKDPNVVNILSIDFTHLDISLITDMSFLFKGCSSLISVNFNNNTNTTSLLNMNSMFSGCAQLNLVDLSSFDTSLVTDMSSLFSGCNLLQTIIPLSLDEKNNGNLRYRLLQEKKFSTSSVKNMNSMFSGCNKIVVIDLSSFDTSKVTNMGGMFSGCSSIKSLDVSNFNTGSVTSLNSMFSGCSSLSSPIVLVVESNELNDIGSLFEGCTSLTSVDLSKFNTGSVTSMNSLFEGCKSLESVDLSNFDTSKVTDMNSMFSGCETLTYIDLSNFDTSKVTDMNSMFSGCETLTYIDLSNFDTSSVNDLSSMLSGCSSIEYLDISSFNMENVKSSDNMFYNLKNLKYINLDGVKGAGTILSGSYLSTLKNLIVNQKENLLGTNNIIKTACYYNIKLGKCESTNLITIFYSEDTQYTSGFKNNYRKGISFIIGKDHNKKIKPTDALSIAKGNKIELYFEDNIKYFEKFFDSTNDKNVKNIKYIDLSHFDTKLITDMSRVFYGCESLTSIDLTDLDTNSVTNMNEMFYGCSLLKSIDLSNSKTTSVISTNKMFAECTSLNYLDISDFDMVNCNDYKDMFLNDNNLRYINWLNLTNTKIISELFSNNKNLYICLKENTITNRNINYCCYYNLENDICENTNPPPIYGNRNSEPSTSTNITSTVDILQTVINSPTKIIDESDETTIVLLGFSHFNHNLGLISFYIYFACTSGSFYSEGLKFPVEISSRRLLRELKDYESNCTLIDEQLTDNIAYSCKVKAEVKNLKNLKIIEQFEFSSQKIKVSISPLAKKYMNNIQEVGDKFNYLLDSSLFILSHSIITKDKSLYFNISGIISNKKPKFEKIELSLNAMTEVENGNNETELNCCIVEIINNNYTLQCEGENNVIYNLNNAISIIEKEILIISFNNNTNNKIVFELNDNTKSNSNLSLSKKKSNFNAGILVAIIVPLVLVFVALVFALIYLRKRNTKKESVSSSDIWKIKD